MIIEKLELHNFGPFEDAELELGRGIIGIFGAGDRPGTSNGAGKSTLVEAVPYALFGRSQRGTLPELRREGANGALSEVGLRLRLEGKRVPLVRQWSETGTRLAYRDTVGSVPEIQASIIRELGLSYPTFLASSFFLQGNSDAFTAAPSSGRLKYLREILELSFWDRCYQIAADVAKELEAWATQLQVQIEEMQRQVQQLRAEHSTFKAANVRRKIEKLKAQIEQWSDKHDQLTIQEYQNKQAAEKLEDLKREDRRLMGELHKAKETLGWMVNERKRVGTGKVEMYAAVGTLIEATKADVEGQAKEIAVTDARLTSEREFIHTVHEGLCPTCRQLVETETLDQLKKVARQTERKLQTVLKELKTERETLIKWLHQLEDRKTHNIKAQLSLDQRAKLPELEVQITATEQQIAALNETLTRSAEIQGLTQQQAEGLEKVRKERAKVGQKLGAMRDELADEQERLTRYEASRERIKQLTGDAKALEAERVETWDNYETHQDLKTSFGKGGLPLAIIQDVLQGELRENANQVLNEVLPGASVSFQLAGGDRDNLNLMVRMGGELRAYESFSGGEREVLNFSIRMALSRLLRNRAVGAAIQCVVLDEVFGPLDEVNKARVEHMLEILRVEFSQIFVISHRPINIPLDQVITVTKVAAGKSEVQD